MRRPSVIPVVKALYRVAILDFALSLAPVCGDTIEAYVVHGESGESLMGIEVAFLLDRGTPEEILRKRTDSGGRISFSGPFLTPDLTFILVPFYRGIPYPTARLRAGTQKQIVLEVFEPDGERADLKIDNLRMVLTVSPEKIEVAQFVEIENQGVGTYTGSGDGKERRVTEFLLPAGAFGLRSISGDLVTGEANQFFDTQPLPPGRSTVAFSFGLDRTTFGSRYRHHFLYPTELLELYLSPATIDLPAPFIDRGEVPIHERPYRWYLLRPEAGAAVVDIPLPTHRPKGWMMKWLALGGALVTALLAAGASRALRVPEETALSREQFARAAGVDPQATREDLERVRVKLVKTLASFPESELASDERARRDDLMRRAAAVYQLLDGEVEAGNS